MKTEANKAGRTCTDSVNKEVAKHNLVLISEPGTPGDGVRAAMILHNGAPIELIEFEKNKG